MAREEQDKMTQGRAPTSSDQMKPTKEIDEPKDTPHTHHTISEDQTGSSNFKRDMLFALDPNSDQSKPVSPFADPSAEFWEHSISHPAITLNNFIGLKSKPQNPQQAGKELETRRLSANVHTASLKKQFKVQDSILNHSTVEKGRREASIENPATNYASLIDRNLLQQLRERIQELEKENSCLRAPEIDACQINMQVFYSLTEDNIYFLSQPDWEIYDGEAFLRGRVPVSDPQSYVNQKGNIAFVVYKYYNHQHQTGSVEEAIKTNKPLPNPEPAEQVITLSSPEMIDAVEAFFSQYPNFRTEFPKINLRGAMDTPFIWWYHCRKSHNIQSLPARQVHLWVILRFLVLTRARLYLINSRLSTGWEVQANRSPFLCGISQRILTRTTAISHRTA